VSVKLPDLPYAIDALSPHVSKETLEFHHGKHHQGYVNKLNAAIEGGKYEKMSLEDMIRGSKGEPKVFNNAAQVWNHTFYWSSMSPNGGGEPGGAMADAIKKSFGSFGKFKEQFSDASATLFGSGWTWVVKEGDKLSIVQTKDADNPLTQGKKPILTCDVWEHAYYIDYRNARPKYIEAFWNLINWEFMEKNL
jgi:Fe-Mn family superoxide dismutase